jgi:asparagine synthase (glutamine-hydrolysing)
MCTIFGYIAIEKDADYNPAFEKNALKFMRHRGPDAENIIHLDKVGLGHQRLAIIDTSPRANQPLSSGKSYITFNGEIYNYKELKAEHLSNIHFRTSSDTEVLLELLKNVGTSCLNLLNGMWAFAYYDAKNQLLTLCRDRFGVKPIYYMVQDGILYFSSEIKPLASIKKKCRRNLKTYLNFFEHVATDYDEETHVQGIYQVKKGHYLECKYGSFKEKCWYNGNDFYFDQSVFDSQRETLLFTEDLLTDAISKRLRSDVPVCITLSGGIDSTVLYTLMKERLRQKLHVFTFIHPGSPTNESDAVIRLAKDYGDTPVTVVTDNSNGIERFEEIIRFLEFPSWSFSALGYAHMYHKIADSGIKVVIEGHGSDEQLGGYPYLIQSAIYSYLKNANIRGAIDALMVFRKTENPALKRVPPFWIHVASIVKKLALNRLEDFETAISNSFDFKILPIVLRTFDRMSMKNSVESRLPYMDYRLVEFFKKLPLKYKVSKIGSKSILRSILIKYQKPFIYENLHKMGFAADEPRLFTTDRDFKIAQKWIDAFNIPEFKNEKLKSQAIIKNKNIDWSHTFLLSRIISLAIIDNIYRLQE